MCDVGAVTEPRLLEASDHHGNNLAELRQALALVDGRPEVKHKLFINDIRRFSEELEVKSVSMARTTESHSCPTLSGKREEQSTSF